MWCHLVIPIIFLCQPTTLSVFLCVGMIPHTQLFPFLMCWWALRLTLYLGYGKSLEISVRDGFHPFLDAEVGAARASHAFNAMKLFIDSFYCFLF